MYDKFREANLPMGGKVYLPRVESNPNQTKKQRTSNPLERVSNKKSKLRRNQGMVQEISGLQFWSSDWEHLAPCGCRFGWNKGDNQWVRIKVDKFCNFVNGKW